MPSTILRRRLARFITNVMNPLVLPGILFGYAASRLEADGAVILHVIGIAVCFFTLVPLFILLLMRRHKYIDGMEVEHRELRIRPFIYGILSMLIGASLFTVTGLQNGEIYQAFGMIPIVNAMIAAFITLRWKISVHAISITSAAVVFWYLSGPIVLAWPPLAAGSIALAAILTSLIVLVQWSRIILNYHSTNQVVAGAILAVLLTVLQLIVYFPTLPFGILV